MNRFALAVLPVALVLVSCGGDDPEDPYGYYFDPSPPYALAACNGTDKHLASRREVRLFQRDGVDLLTLSQGLARYYRRHGLSFYTRSAPAVAATPYAVNSNLDELGEALVTAFPDVDFNDEAAIENDPVLLRMILKFTMNFILEPIIDFARTEGTLGTGLTNMVAVENLERPGASILSQPGYQLAGLAISPTLHERLKSLDNQEAQVWQDVELPPDFTPMFFLDHTVLERNGQRAADLRDLIVAHEFGHTLGLIHEMEKGNLMFPGVAVGEDDCENGLEPEQITLMRQTLGLGGTTGSLRAADHPIHRGAPRAAEGPGPFTARDLRSLLDGEGQALRKLLAPLLEQATALPTNTLGE